MPKMCSLFCLVYIKKRPLLQRVLKGYTVFRLPPPDSVRVVRCAMKMSGISATTSLPPPPTLLSLGLVQKRDSGDVQLETKSQGGFSGVCIWPIS